MEISCTRKHLSQAVASMVVNMSAWEKFGSGLRPKIGKRNTEKWILASPQKGENGPKIGKMAQNPFGGYFSAIFSYLWAIFHPFSRWGQNPFFGVFCFLFWPVARADFLPGGHVRNSMVHMSGKTASHSGERPPGLMQLVPIGFAACRHSPGPSSPRISSPRQETQTQKHIP